jgi:putative ABC transport system permease protein
MRILDILIYAFGAIRRKRTRKLLAIMGVAIGIAAITSLVSLSYGFRTSVTAQFQRGFSPDTVVVTTGSTDFLETESDFDLYVNDTVVIDRIENVKKSVAMVQKTCFLKSGNREFTVNVIGVDFEKYASVYPKIFIAESGTMPATSDALSVVVGARINDPWKNGTLLGSIGDAVNITWTTRDLMQVENRTFVGRLTATLKEIGGASVGGPSDVGVYVSITTAQDFFQTDKVRTIIVQLIDASEEKIQATSQAIEATYGGQVQAVTQKAVLDAITSIVSTIELFLTGISAISLLVAGVGIMNIMLTSLMERTKEIGILRSLGMLRRTVLGIFLSEALTIGLLGSIIGICLGCILAIAVNQFGLVSELARGTQNTLIGEVSLNPVFSPLLLFSAVGFGVAVSVIFGLYPAWRAAHLAPVEALRYE